MLKLFRSFRALLAAGLVPTQDSIRRKHSSEFTPDLPAKPIPNGCKEYSTFVGEQEYTVVALNKKNATRKFINYFINKGMLLTEKIKIYETKVA